MYRNFKHYDSDQFKLDIFNSMSAKLQYFEILDCNSKPFWKACKPYFSNKNSNIQENIMLLEKDKMLSNKRMSLQFSINILDQLQTR